MATLQLPQDAIVTRIANALCEQLGQRQYDMWFKATELDVEKDQLVVKAPNAFVAQWIHSKFETRLNHLAQAEGLGQKVKVDQADQGERNERAWAIPAGSQTSVNTEASTPQQQASTVEQRSIKGMEIAASPVAHSPIHNPRRKSMGNPAIPNAQLAMRHSLDDFVVGPCNELAFCSAHQMIEDENCLIGALFVHGVSGVGKTHLLQGICSKFIEQRPHAKWLYTSAEHFTNEYIRAVRDRKLEHFRDRVRSLDLLVVDDVHFIAGKNGTQQEFLHTFDAMDLGGARVVMASDCHPREIKALSKPLASRFMGGMVVRMDLPDALTRRRLIKQYAQRREWQIEESVLQQMVEKSNGSVREMEGFLTRLSACAMLQVNGSTDALVLNAAVLDRAEQMSQPHAQIRTQSRPVSFKTILHVVSEKMNVEIGSICGKGRNARVVMARSLCVHLARKMTTMSYPEIAVQLDRKNHSTMISADRRIQGKLDSIEEFEAPGFHARMTMPALVHGLSEAVYREQR